MSDNPSDDNQEQDNGNPNILGNLDELGQEVNDLDKIFKQMLDPLNIHHFTELSRAEIIGFSSMYAQSKLAAKYKIDYTTIDEWLIHNLKFRVSLGRKGRLELVKITSRSGEGMSQQGPGRSPWGMFRRD